MTFKNIYDKVNRSVFTITEAAMSYRYQLLYTRSEIKSLRKAKVALCGLGGYGSALVDPLSRYEIGELRFADFDSFEETNLDRQMLAKFSTLGERKVDVASKLVADITKHTRVVTFSNGVRPESILSFVRGANVVIDLCDQLSAKLLLHIFCSKSRVPLVTGGSAVWPSREGLRVTMYRYDWQSFTLSDVFQPKKWGISKETWSRFLRVIETGQMATSVLRSINEENAVFRSLHTPKSYNSQRRVAWNAGGGYDPLKIYTLTAGIFIALLKIVIGREPTHGKISTEIFGF